jgi:hypothetical protein
VIKSDVSIASFTLNSSGELICPPGASQTISPAWTVIANSGCPVGQTRPVPSKTMNLPVAASKIAVPPLIAADTAAALTLTSAAPGGIWIRIAPLLIFKSRVPGLKLKTVFDPRRVMVRSVKVSSVRESVPVRTAVPNFTSSLTTAGRGAA